MTTKLYVDNLSATSLSTDYLYAEDSNIKADVKIEPVDNGGEKIATITVNGVPTEISAKKIDVDDSFSFESTNPVQNKVITELIKKLGVFTQDELDNLLDKENPDGITDFIEDSTEEEFKGVDTVERVENSSINSMFI